MEKLPATNNSNVEKHDQEHGGGLPSADDSGNVVDEPPIPSAGSSAASVLIKNEIDADAARFTTNSSVISIDAKDGSDIHAHAHTLSADNVAVLLGSQIQ